jgi:hypothetical protein
VRRRKTIDWKLIMSFRPCPPWSEERVREAVPKRITLIEFLRSEHISPEDRLWVTLHDELLSDRLMRLFACDVADRILQRERDIGTDIHPCIPKSIAVSRQYAVGNATLDELIESGNDAYEAAYRTFRTGRAFTLASACSSSLISESLAAYDTAIGAVMGVQGSAMVSEFAWQLNHLIEMIEAEQDTTG